MNNYNKNKNILKSKYKLVLEEIENILEKKEEEVNIRELIWVIDDLIFFQDYQPNFFNPSDKEKSEKFLELFKGKLEAHIQNLIDSQASKEVAEREARELYPFIMLLQNPIRQRFAHFLKDGQQFHSQIPTNYRVWLSIGLGLVVLFSLLIVHMISLVVDKIKGKENQ